MALEQNFGFNLKNSNVDMHFKSYLNIFFFKVISEMYENRPISR